MPLSSSLLPSELPVFPVRTNILDHLQLDRLATGLLRMKQYAVRQEGSKRRLHSESLALEFHRQSGGIWGTDRSQLWQVRQDVQLLDPDAALAKAELALNEHGLLPKLADPFGLRLLKPGGTKVAIQDKNGRSDFILDTQIRFGAVVRVGDVEAPLVGGGGKFSMTLGHEGAVLAFQSLWRPLDTAKDVRLVRAIGLDEADAQFRELVVGLKIIEFERSLNYFAASVRTKQAFLFPVYVYRAVAQIGEQKVELRPIQLPATEAFGPAISKAKPRHTRQPVSTPETATLAAEITGHVRRSLLSEGLFEDGAWYVTPGLPKSQRNAEGFFDALQDAGWNSKFLFGDVNAFKSDWLSDNDNYVDSVDFAFYSGHANAEGWMLAPGSDEFLHCEEVGLPGQAPGDRWGQLELEWLAIAACGPLQDDQVAPGSGSVFKHWEGAFDGLHLMLGYASTSYDSDEEGEALVEYARDGETLIDAWFHAARELQPSTAEPVQVAAMYAEVDGTPSPKSDHLWGYGSVTSPPKTPDRLTCIWTTI